MLQPEAILEAILILPAQLKDEKNESQTDTVMCPNHRANKLVMELASQPFHSQSHDNEEERNLCNVLPNMSLEMANQWESNLLVMWQSRWYHNFIPVITFGPPKSIKQGEQATEDQGFHKQF